MSPLTSGGGGRILIRLNTLKMFVRGAVIGLMMSLGPPKEEGRLCWILNRSL